MTVVTGAGPHHQHGAPHQRRPRGLHPHGQDQHGGVHQEFEKKVRPVLSVFSRE